MACIPKKQRLPGRLSFPLIIFFACTVTSTANLRSKILWRHVLGPRMLWIYYRGLVYNSGLTRANRVPLEVRVSTYVPECLSLFATRHDEPRTRQRIVRNDIVPPRVRPIMSLRFLPTRLSFSFLVQRSSFLVYRSSISFCFFLFFFLDYFYRIMLMREAMVKHEFSKRYPLVRRMNFLSCRMQTRLLFFEWKKSWQIIYCTMFMRFFFVSSFLDLEDFG